MPAAIVVFIRRMDWPDGIASTVLIQIANTDCRHGFPIWSWNDRAAARMATQAHGTLLARRYRPAASPASPEINAMTQNHNDRKNEPRNDQNVTDQGQRLERDETQRQDAENRQARHEQSQKDQARQDPDPQHRKEQDRNPQDRRG